MIGAVPRSPENGIGKGGDDVDYVQGKQDEGYKRRRGRKARGGRRVRRMSVGCDGGV